MKLLACMVALAASLGCRSLGPASSAGLEGRWAFVEVDGEFVNGAEIAFEGGRLSGTTGVNRFSASFERSGEALHIGPLVTTKMAGPPERMRQEQLLLDVLARIDGWSIDDGMLKLLAGEHHLALLLPSTK